MFLYFKIILQCTISQNVKLSIFITFTDLISNGGLLKLFVFIFFHCKVMRVAIFLSKIILQCSYISKLFFNVQFPKMLNSQSLSFLQI